MRARIDLLLLKVLVLVSACTHVYVVLDSATYRDIASSEFIRTALAGARERTTRADGGFSWSGLYITGRDTYIELFPPAGVGLAEGRSGIGFNVADSGQSEVIRSRLSTFTQDSIATLTRTRRRGNIDEAWFFAVGSARDPDPAVRRWVMEYHPNEIRRTGRDSLDAAGRLTRRRLPHPAYRPDLSLLNIEGIVIALTEADHRLFLGEMAAYGWTIHRDPLSPTDRVLVEGPGVRIQAERTSEGDSRLAALQLRLTAPWVGQTVLRFGPRSVLTLVDSTTAVWTF